MSNPVLGQVKRQKVVSIAKFSCPRRHWRLRSEQQAVRCGLPRNPPRTKKSGRLVSTLFGECLGDLATSDRSMSTNFRVADKNKAADASDATTRIPSAIVFPRMGSKQIRVSGRALPIGLGPGFECSLSFGERELCDRCDIGREDVQTPA
jgi:hypothetical protein